MKKKQNVYWTLFYETFMLSACTFGGGYVIIPLMKKKFSDELGWIEESEILNLAAIAQSSPGAVAVNASILVGYHIAGVLGALMAILGTVLPPLLILSVISLFYDAFRQNRLIAAMLEGMQAGVAAVIADVVLNIGGNVLKLRSRVSTLVMFGAFIATLVFGVNVIYIILACGVIGGVRVLVNERKQAASHKDSQEDTE